MSDDDITLATLKDAAAGLAPDLDLELLLQCYQIQKRYQFIEDRTIPAREMDKVIDAFVRAHEQSGANSS